MAVGSRFKRYFFRGLGVILPTLLTIGIFVWGFRFIQSNISFYINQGIVWLQMNLQGLDYGNKMARQDIESFWVHGIGSLAGFFIALIAVFVIGIIFASVVGKSLWRMFESFIMKTPILKHVYPYIKQVTDFFFSEEQHSNVPFSRVVAAEYPRKGIWTVGFVTGSGLRKVTESVKDDLLTIFIPTSPTPFTGFIIMVPRTQTIELDMTVEEAFRFTVSGGVITPEGEKGITFVPKTAAPAKDNKEK